ncbi:hypothetical protein [Burkholderia glumae]|uniref:hypothetical protein n=1 Tax=Burkholderia glumae TaxID=337 RepID=UPI0012FB3046|nr:hypothetical protein [Burkholderia glumae]
MRGKTSRPGLDDDAEPNEYASNQEQGNQTDTRPVAGRHEQKTERTIAWRTPKMKKRCWIPSNSALGPGTLCLDCLLVLHLQNLFHGASELKRRLNNPRVCDNLAFTPMVHRRTKIGHKIN